MAKPRKLTMLLTVTVRNSKHGYRLTPAQIRAEIRYGINSAGEYAGDWGDERIRVASLRSFKP